MNGARALALLAALTVLAVLLGPCGPGSSRVRGGPANVLRLPSQPTSGDASGAARAGEIEHSPDARPENARVPAAAPSDAVTDEAAVQQSDGQWDGPFATGRAVDRRGRALAEREVIYRVVEVATPFISRIEPLHPLEGRASTDGAGRFRVPVGLPMPLEGLRLDLTDDRGRPLRGFAFLPWSLERVQVHDVGDVSCVPPVDLARGRVVDDRGQPVEGATVEVMCTVHPVAPPGDDPADYRPYERNLPHATTGTDAEGRFILRGDSPTSELLLHVAHEDHLAAGRRCMRGDTGVDVVLRSGAAFAGRVLLDPGVPADHVRVVLREKELSGRAASAAPDAEGRFGWRGRRPGPAQLEVRLGDAAAPIFVLDDLVLLAGQELRDARVDPLDLRGRLQVVHLTVVDGEGTPQRGARAALLGQAALHPSRWRADHLGRIRLVVAEPIDLRVHAPGVGAAVVREVREDATVTLGSGRDVTVAVELLGELRSGEELRVELIDHATPGGLSVGSALLDHDFTCVVRAAYDGRLAARAWLLTDTGGFLVQGIGTTEVVEVGPGVATVRLRVDEAALARAREHGR